MTDKLTKHQWSLLQLIERSPVSENGWSECTSHFVELFKVLPRELVSIDHPFGGDMNIDYTKWLVCLTPMGRALLKYGTCPK
jgi:hypothetical protein